MAHFPICWRLVSPGCLYLGRKHREREWGQIWKMRNGDWNKNKNLTSWKESSISGLLSTSHILYINHCPLLMWLITFSKCLLFQKFASIPWRSGLLSFPWYLGVPLWLSFNRKYSVIPDTGFLWDTYRGHGHHLGGNSGSLCFGSPSLRAWLIPTHPWISLHLGSLSRFSEFGFHLLLWESLSTLLVDCILLSLIACCPD